MKGATIEGRDARARGLRYGMNWISQKKRLAIYLRDGLSCAWCGESVETGVKLTLDHVVPHCQGGTNKESNLVTCCKRCNDSRGKRSLTVFAGAVAGYLNHGLTAKVIRAHVVNCARRELKSHLAEASAMIERRGSASKVLASFR